MTARHRTHSIDLINDQEPFAAMTEAGEHRYRRVGHSQPVAPFESGLLRPWDVVRGQCQHRPTICAGTPDHLRNDNALATAGKLLSSQ
jgi:hypothetical protein